MEDKRILYVIPVALVLILLFVLFSFFTGTQNQGIPAGGAYINLMGAPIYLHHVEGKDIPCIGAPQGYTRVFFQDESDLYPDTLVSITVGYAKEGDHLEDLVSWIRSRAEECDFTKQSEEAAAIPGAHGYTISYAKGDYIDLSVDAGVVTGSDGKTYTILRLGYEEYNREAYEGGDTEEAGSSGGQEPSGDTVLVGTAKRVDEQVRPVLEQVFGSPVRVKQASSVQGYGGIDYVIPRAATANDFQTLVAAFENSGWNALQESQQGEHIAVGFIREGQMLSVEYDVGGDIVSIVYGSQ